MPLKIALIQQHLASTPDENRARGVLAVREAARQGAALAAFPELAFLPFFPQKRGQPPRELAETVPGATTELFSRLAKELGIVIVLNLYERDGERFFDASPVIDADGSLLGVTRMIHIIDAPCFREQDYYTPGDRGAPVYQTAAGRLGVAICYDRHYPEYMRALGHKGAELVVVPQAGAVDEWPEGLFEAELQVAGFQNGYFTALANRVGAEECITFAGESFVTDPAGKVIARAPRGKDHVLYAELDLAQVENSHARRHFLPDQRAEAELWRDKSWLTPEILDAQLDYWRAKQGQTAASVRKTSSGGRSNSERLLK